MQVSVSARALAAGFYCHCSADRSFCDDRCGVDHIRQSDLSVVRAFAVGVERDIAGHVLCVDHRGMFGGILAALCRPDQFGVALRRAQRGVWSPLLAGFLVADVILILLDPSLLTLLREDPRADLTFDGGYAELFRYLQLFLASAVLGSLAFRRQDALLALWSLLFAYVVLDDALRVHETVGIWLSDHIWAIGAMGQLAHAVAEVLYLVLLGAAWLSVYLVVASRCQMSIASEQLDLLLIGVFLVATCIGVDFLHSVGDVFGWRGLRFAEGLVELLAISVAAAYVLQLPTAGDRIKR